MSTPAGSLPSAAPAAPAPPPAAPSSAPAIAPQTGSSAPAAAPTSAPAAAVPPVIAEAIAPPSAAPGASTASTERPKTIEEAQARLAQRVAGIQEEATQPVEAAPAEVQPEAAPVEQPPAPVTAQPEAAPAALETGSEDLDTILTAELVDAKYPRMHKDAKAALVTREAARGELMEKVRTIGGDPGLRIAEAINPIIWNENPTDADVDAFFDTLVLRENAGATKLFDLMGKRLVNIQLQDEHTGRDFGSNMLTEEFGAGYDLPFVENVINLHKSWGVGEDGKPIDFATVDKLVRGLKEGVIDMEYVDGELSDKAPAPVDPEKLALQQELEALKKNQTTEETAKTEAAKAEETRLRETNKAIYKTQATNWISRQLLNEVMPLAAKANWVPGEGADSTAPQTTFGKMISAYINTEIMGTANAPKPEYKEVMQMIEENSAFTPDGKPTPRFKVKLDPLRTRARALFALAQKDLGGSIKFATTSSRNAQLVKQNGGNRNGAATEAPPLATTQPERPAAEQSADEKIAALKRKHEDRVRAIYAEANAGQL